MSEILVPIKSLNGHQLMDETARNRIEEVASEIPAVPVQSVNNKTGAVQLSASDVGALPASTQIPSKTNQLENNSGFITKTVSDLQYYYLKSQSYTKDEIDQKISAIPKFSISVVANLPTANISETTVYLVSGGDSDDLYTEWIYVNGKWEILGSQRVDLTGYAEENWVSGQLAGYQPKGDYALKSELPSVPTSLSQLKDDATHRVVTDTEKAAWNAKSNFSGDYNDLANKPTIPTVPVQSVNNKTGAVKLTASDVGADASGTATSIVNTHNQSTTAHSDIRATVSQLVAEIGVIPDYVKTEAESVIERVSAAQTGRTFTFAAITDLHYGNGGYTDGVLHACQALKHIDSRLKLDAVAVLGDYTDGYPASGLANAFADFRTINNVLNNLRFAPNLRMQGNHDFYADHAAEIRRHIQSYSEDVVWGNIYGSYYCKDFEAYKLRVICLNTTETDNANIGCSNAQYQWFADSLDLSVKDDAEEWQILVLSHHPLDWYHSDEKYVLARIANAYHEGTSYSTTGVSCNFSGKNTAKLICNIHGHIHNLLVDNIHLGNVASGVKSNVYRMATPEACINRANQYDGAWKEATSYPKTINTADDTSFVIYCINLDTHTISAICYGAGCDRTLVYYTETVVYNIAQTLTNVTSSNTAINITQGEAFTTTLTAQSGYELGTIKITMGGADVTASALSGSKITISSVTGDIVITATATLIQTGPAYTNQIPISKTTTGEIFDGDGIKADTRLNSSGAETTLAGTAVTGYVPIKLNDVVRFKNINYKPGVNSTGNYIALYKPDFTNFKSDKDGTMTDGVMTYLYADRVKDADGRLIQFRIADGSQDYGYMRVSAAGLNADSIITINEEITD